MEWMEVSHADRKSILAAIQTRFGNEVKDRKAVGFVGGVPHPSARQVSVIFSWRLILTDG